MDAHSSAVMLVILMHDGVMHDKWVVGASPEPAIWWVIKASRSSIMRSIIYEAINTSSAFSTLCFFYCTGLSSTMFSLFFIGEELNLQQFYLCMLSVDWFWKPFSILCWEQEAGSARHPAACVFSWFMLRLLAC